jgi:hypothetical protein
MILLSNGNISQLKGSYHQIGGGLQIVSLYCINS